MNARDRLDTVARANGWTVRECAPDPVDAMRGRLVVAYYRGASRILVTWHGSTALTIVRDLRQPTEQWARGPLRVLAVLAWLEST